MHVNCSKYSNCNVHHIKIQIFHHRCTFIHIVVPTNDESICCQEIQKIAQIVEEFNSEITPTICITQHPGLETGCLKVWTLQIAYLQIIKTMVCLTSLFTNEYDAIMGCLTSLFTNEYRTITCM